MRSFRLKIPERLATRLACILHTMALMVVPLPRLAAQQSVADRPFSLAPGVIVASARQTAFVMSPEGGVDAVDLNRGTQLWRSAAADKPLVLAGDLLVCQGGRSPRANELEIVVLNVMQGGEQVLARSVTLPEGVVASIDQTLTSTFRMVGRPSDGGVAVSWEYGAYPERIRGMPDSAVVGPPEREPEISFVRGGFRLDLTSGEVSALSEEAVLLAITPRAQDVRPEDRFDNAPRLQFLSADSLHVLATQRIARDPEWDRYRWSIHDRVTRERVAEIRSHWQWAPFFVRDGTIVYQTESYVRQIDQELLEEGKRLRATDLSNGEELWTWPIRDTSYRGPIPS